ncbi:nuclear transport factor 2 family protein [Winogradskyella sp. A3E31]|uniref:nuclear transport factor 2 family protein n=1 Tax=Winogradskyella sp. A3E31 TaxID=3349637 RepID=UPI00398ABED7
MKSSKSTSTTIYQKLIATCALFTFFLLLSFKSNKNETPPETRIETTNTIMKSASKTAEEILAQEKAWAAALLAYDLTTVDSIMHRDFRLKGVIGDQPPISKEVYLGMKGMSATVAEVTSVKIVEEMGSIAVARVTWTMDWARNGVKLPPYWDLIDTWIKREDGTWQVLSRLSQPTDKPYNANQKD